MTLRGELINEILTSVRKHGKASTAQEGAERAADAVLPLVQRKDDKLQKITEYINDKIMYSDTVHMEGEAQALGVIVNDHVAHIVLDIREILERDETEYVGNFDGSGGFDMPVSELREVITKGKRASGCNYNFAEGWWCSRERGHDGPCALRPI